MRLAVSIALFFISPSLPVFAAHGLTIEILQGDGAIHNVRERQFVEPVIRVSDNGQAVGDAIVTFLLPQVGPSGRFQEGPVLTLTTGPDGTATARGFRPNSLTGQFEIRVTVSHNGRSARGSLLQTNAAPVEALARKSRSRTYLILGLIAGGAVAGAASALGGNSGSPATSTPATPLPPPAIVRPPATISAGTGSIGAPGQ